MLTEPNVLTIVVSNGVCEYWVDDKGAPLIVRFKDYDNIKAGDEDVWQYTVYNANSFQV